MLQRVTYAPRLTWVEPRCKGGLFAALLLLLLPQPLFAADADPDWALRITPLWMRVNGWDDTAGEVVVERGPFPPRYASAEQISNTLPSSPAIRMELSRREGLWQLELAGWGFRTSDSLGGSVTVPAAEVLFWQQPPPQFAGGQLFGTKAYTASERLSTYTIDLLAFRRLAETRDHAIGWGGGLRIASINTEQDQSLSSVLSRRFFPLLHVTNAVLDQASEADAKYSGGGPVVAAWGEAQKGAVRFRGAVTQAVLIGSARLSGTYTTVDQRSYTPLFPGAPTPPPPTTQVGKIAFGQSSAEVLPVTELQLYVAVDLGGGISVGLGGFLSVWWNAPVPPTLQVSSTAVDLGAGASSGQPPIRWWSPQRRTLMFPGLGVQLSARF